MTGNLVEKSLNEPPNLGSTPLCNYFIFILTHIRKNLGLPLLTKAFTKPKTRLNSTDTSLVTYQEKDEPPITMHWYMCYEEERSSVPMYAGN